MSISRRDLLIGVPSLAAGFVASQALASGAETSPVPSGAFRIAHLTDMHILPEPGPMKNVERAVQHAQENGAQLVINGGDAIHDAARLAPGQSDPQWEALKSAFVANCGVPILNVVGNHDVDGWSAPNPDEKYKLNTLQKLGLDRSYYSVEHGGWKLIVVDSIAFSPGQRNGYLGQLGREQYTWLAAELEKTELPCCIISHVPILTVCGFFDGKNERQNFWHMPGDWMHLDSRAIKDLFYHFKQVKLCLSGHIHLVDRLDYLGVTYLCNGAVSGWYWKGPYQETPPGYALIDLFPDGTFKHQMMSYASP